jgi:hypothetical protein
MNMRIKRMLRRGLTALAAALAMMTALAAPAFAYAGDFADSTAEIAEQQFSGNQTAVQTERIGTVTTNGGRLNLRDGASTSYNIIGQLPCGDTVTVIGEENGWYRVIVPEKEGYVYGGYLKVSEGTVMSNDNADGGSPNGTENSASPLTPDGNLELVDDVYQASDGKQFITVQSKNDNTFYIVIDRDKNGENVYFLNLVDEADLMALMQDGEVTVKCTCTDRCEAGDVDMNCPVCKTNLTECTGTVKEEPKPTAVPEEPEEPEPEKSSSAPLLLLLLIAGLGTGGSVYWFKFRKPKPDTKGPDDLDDYDFGEDDEDDEEEYITEDDQPDDTDEA